MLGYFRIDFECNFFCCWCWLVFLEVVDCFRGSLDVEVFQRVFIGFWVNFLMFLPVDVWNRMFLKENYHCFLIEEDGNLPSRKFACKNCRLAAHLGLHTPHGATMMVGEHELNWKEGQAIVFDVPLMNKRQTQKEVVDVEVSYGRGQSLRFQMWKLKILFFAIGFFVEQAGKEMYKKSGSWALLICQQSKRNGCVFCFVAVPASIMSTCSAIEARIPISTVSPMKDPWLIVVHTTDSIDQGWKLCAKDFMKTPLRKDRRVIFEMG